MEIICKNVTCHNPFSEYHDDILDVTYTFQSKYIYGVIGTSGSGKTTLLELLADMKVPNSGLIQIKTTKAKQRNIGYLRQNLNHQFIGITVEEELKYTLEAFSYRIKEIDKRIKEVLMMVGLNENYLKRKIDSLSHGEKRKLGIASILVYNPKILLLDEPTLGLSPQDKKDFIRLIKRLKNNYHKLIIIAGHDVEFIHAVCDQICVLEQGSIFLEGNKYDVFSQEEQLKKIQVRVPQMIAFSNLVYKKIKIKMGYRDEMNDLIKDVYRYVK